MSEAYPVYIVDDDPNFRQFMALLCREQGLDCTCFGDGAEFLSNIEGLGAGCILLDMRMPRMSGLQVQQELARRGNPCPVIAVTGYGEVEIAVQSMKLGAVEFLEKPFKLEVLLGALEQGFAILRKAEG